MTYLAHSARPDRGIPEQEYRDHIENVVVGAIGNADRAAMHAAKYGDLLRAAVRLAAEFHDLGKLDETNQEVLRTNSGKMLNHVDASVAHLLDGSPNSVRTVAALAAFAHHIGLPTIAEEGAKGAGKVFRDAEPISDGTPLRELTNGLLNEYRRRHESCLMNLPVAKQLDVRSAAPPMLLRLALSCLVDADHSDTARHYRDPVADQTPPSLAPEKRLKLLDEHVAELGRHRNDERTHLRAEVYRQCREADCSAGMLACDSPVGSGKTTAIMAHLLKAAAAKKLRRVFVVLPFTNIIDQSVAVYRKALVHIDEAADDIVVAHHHRAEFDDPVARQYSFLWHAPVVVTTAVQFFETLAARCPASVRKLHQVAGSAIFIDEAHTALPAQLWPQAWKWLRELERDWNCHIVLGSGSLHRFWELPDFVDPPTMLPPLVPDAVRDSSADHERRRVKYRSRSESLDLEGLAKFVKKTEGPRLLIVNTVQSAAAIARHLAKEFGGEHVEHLSTALTPRDRQATLELVKRRLRQPNHRDWTLVATSCVEAGVDFSFRTGIRERCSLTSLLQISGRVNRSNEYRQTDVWDIQLRHDHLLRPHPAFEASSRVLGELFVEDKVSPDFCTEALRREITQEGMPKKKKDIDAAERNADFPTVEKLFRVIDSDTVTAIVDEALIVRLEAYEKITRAELQSASVQIWHNKEQEFGLERLERVRGYDDLRKWKLPYDRFLGYMAGVLPLVDGGHNGFVI
jgi:CRISPR-associated endonuclease/helicase Cas3